VILHWFDGLTSSLKQETVKDADHGRKRAAAVQRWAEWIELDDDEGIRVQTWDRVPGSDPVWWTARTA